MRDFNPEIDYYAVLQVHPEAHQEVIKRAFRTIVGLLQAHPDVGGTHEDAIRLNEAYQVLSDEKTRQAYDGERRRRAQAAKAYAMAGRGAEPAARSHGYSRGASTGSQMVYCPSCGARNRLPYGANRARAVCGRCHATLSTSTNGHTKTAYAPSGEIRLPDELQRRLKETGEVRLQRSQMPSDRRLHCLRCRHGWTQPSGTLPAACPHCHSTLWSDFRLFNCRHCNHRFTTTHLVGWPYWLHRTCPACHRQHWHAGCEKHPLRWVMNRLAG